jgi:hypothetical protein
MRHDVASAPVWDCPRSDRAMTAPSFAGLREAPTTAIER